MLTCNCERYKELSKKRKPATFYLLQVLKNNIIYTIEHAQLFCYVNIPPSTESVCPVM